MHGKQKKTMGRHKEWRSLVKKMRRKRLRQIVAKEREEVLRKEQERRENSPHYQAILAEQNALENFQEEEEARQEILTHQKWLEEEELAQKRFIERQKKLALMREEKLKQEKLIRDEWEAEQSILRAKEEEARKLQEEKKLKEELLMKQIDDFIKKGGELPPAANVSTETHPEKEPCPFFSKTGACRFGDHCSRNHLRPGISKVLLIPSFYSHFGMDQSMADEYDTDLMLEYEDSETYHHFKDFYEDVLPEFESCGGVVQFKVCCNGEPHLRGNVYVEYTNERYAIKAYQKFHGRYYGGKQLNVEFTCVSSWKAALCGLYFKKRCPKGRNCNFLHVFRNPGNAFHQADYDKHHSRQRQRQGGRSRSRSPFSTPISQSNSHRSPEDRRNWRWSESPEPLARLKNSSSEGRDWSRSPRRRKIESESRHKNKISDRSKRSKDRSERTNGRIGSRSRSSHRKERKRKRMSRSRSKER